MDTKSDPDIPFDTLGKDLTRWLKVKKYQEFWAITKTKRRQRKDIRQASVYVLW